MDIEKDAKELLESAKKLRKGESKGAPPASPAETKKTKEELEKEAQVKADKEKVEAEAKKKAEDEAQVKKDEELLSKKDEELDDKGKSRKKELLDKKEKSNTQKRIDELTSKVKAIEADRDATKAEKEAVRTELEDLKRELSKTPQDVQKENIKKEMSTIRQKYLDEDKELNREDRREMSQEELEEWRTEDFDAASEWATKRSIRRVREEEGYVKKHIDTQAYRNLLEKQFVSQKKLLEKHPELDVTKRTIELEKEGKKPDEIFKTLSEEIPKYKLAAEILNENREKYVLSEIGPELISKEIERRSSKANEASDIESMRKELAEVRAELERVAGLDVGLKSTHSPVRKVESEMTTELKNLAKELKLDPEKVASRAKARGEIGGR